MSLLEVLQLIGYGLGAALPLWLSGLLARQRRALAAQERVLFALAVCAGGWHLSNLLLALHELLGLSVARWELWLRLTDTLAVVCVTLTYSLLLHVHLHLWANARARPLTRFEHARVWLSYVPALFLLVSVPRVWAGAYAPMQDKLALFVLPFGLWAGYVLSLVAATDWLIARRSQSPSERRLMHALAWSFLFVGALLVAVYAFGVGSGTDFGRYVQTFAKLGSLLPTALIAYHIYRYRYLELIIKESLVVAVFAAVVLVVYLYGIRTVEGWLASRYQLREGALEALLILVCALAAAPLRAALERRVQKLFAREAALYREVVARIGAHAGRYRELPELLRFVAEHTTRELGLRRISFYQRPAHLQASDNAEEIVAFSSNNGNVGKSGKEKTDEGEVLNNAALNDGRAAMAGEMLIDAKWAERIFEASRRQGWASLHGGELLRDYNFDLAMPLCREGQVFGLMLVDASEAALTHDARAVLEVLAGQVAIALEDSRLVEANVELERKLAHGERLAALGQMAATVAHEIKNPLSAIKSIAQVLREDERMTENYARDLDLIVSETDRLSRSVSQMLQFARHAPPTGSAFAPVADLVHLTVGLFRAEAARREISLAVEVETLGALFGEAQANALRDALSNLLLNALQATVAGGRIQIETRLEDTSLVCAVTDGGGGVPAELRERIWEPFFTTKQRGTGLGLAIVRKRVEEAGGTVRLARTPDGRGARFELRLPALAEDIQSSLEHRHDHSHNH